MQFRTRNTLYTLEDQGDGAFLISGHEKFCPTPTRVTLAWPVTIGQPVCFTTQEANLREGVTTMTTRVQEVLP